MPKIKETSVPILNYLLDYFWVFSSHLNQLKYLCGVAVSIAISQLWPKGSSALMLMFAEEK